MNNTSNKLEEKANKASVAGHYSLKTLQLYASLWRQQQNFTSWLAHAVFKRQLGYPLSQAQLRVAKKWANYSRPRQLLNGIYGHRKRQLINLLDEVLETSSAPAVKSPYVSQVVYWRQHQRIWWQQFIDKIRTHSVAVVGNSPSISGLNKGAEIDAHDTVIRFNRFASELTSERDTGEKLTVWVMAPGYQGPVPDSVEWIIVAGPQMINWQQRWPQLIKHNAKVLGVPLSYWRQCVSQLKSPPSAGFLIVQALLQQPIKQLSLIGFGVTNNGPYHYALKNHKAASRHNWDEENRLMHEWTKHHQL